MTPQQAEENYKRNGTYYFDHKGFKRLRKMVKKLVQQSKYATTEACCLCKHKDYLGVEYTQEKFCPRCHVNKLIGLLGGKTK